MSCITFYIFLHFQRLEDEYDEEQAEEDVRLAVIIITYILFRFLNFSVRLAVIIITYILFRFLEI